MRYVYGSTLFVLILYCEADTGYDPAVPGICSNVKENSPGVPATGVAERPVGALGLRFAVNVTEVDATVL